MSLTPRGAGGLPGGPAADARRASAGGRIAAWGALHGLFLADIPGFRSSVAGLAGLVKDAVAAPTEGTLAAGETAEETAAVRLAVATVVAAWRAVAAGRPGVEGVVGEALDLAARVGAAAAPGPLWLLPPLPPAPPAEMALPGTSTDADGGEGDEAGADQVEDILEGV